MVHEYLGHAHSYDSFLPAAADAVPSASQLHSMVSSLQSWMQSLLKSTPGAGGNSELKSDADRQGEVEFVTASAKQLGCAEDVASLLASAYLAREPELVAHARALSVSSFAEWSLKDYDWSARVTLASSALSNLRTPVVLLSLLLAAPDGRTRTVQMELDQAGLDSVLAQMAQVNAVVQEYSTTEA